VHRHTPKGESQIGRDEATHATDLHHQPQLTQNRLKSCGATMTICGGGQSTENFQVFLSLTVMPSTNHCYPFPYSVGMSSKCGTEGWHLSYLDGDPQPNFPEV
jgi:hypothetical protein